MKRLAWIVLFFFLITGACGGLNHPALLPGSPAPSQTVLRLPPSVPGGPETEAEPLSRLQPGVRARSYLEALSREIGNRTANSDGESAAAQYLQTAFKKMGYAPQVQLFSYQDQSGKTIHDANIFVEKKGRSDAMILVGAHYDSVNVGRGADDNASGVAVMLEAAERVKDLSIPYTLRFIAFGSEEEGEKGSTFYARQMDAADVARTVVMVNLDSLIAGDFTYVYGSQGQSGQVRDWTLEKARARGLDLITQPGLNSDYPAGTTGDFSDQAPFRAAGIQYAYFEASNWTLGDKDGYTQVDPRWGELGKIWHTHFDTLDYLDQAFPGRVDAHLSLFSTLLLDILTEYQQPVKK
jgi:alkaline phosphatase isozyme conversion protein